MLGKLICNLYALLYCQHFILGKCGCYKPNPPPLIGISPSRFKKRLGIIQDPQKREREREKKERKRKRKRKKGKD
jgi:hypothetical protein